MLDAKPCTSYPQPIAGPVVLGLYAYAGSIMTITPWLVGWIPDQQSLQYAAPFVVVFGGVAQLSAALWAFRARQALPTFISAAWATEHAAWALLFLLFAAQVFPQPQGAFPGFGIWYLALGWVSWLGVVLAVRMNWLTVITLFTGAFAATLLGVADSLGPPRGVLIAGGWILIVSATGAWYTASAMLLHDAYGRWLLPLGLANAYRDAPQVAPGAGEAGVKRG